MSSITTARRVCVKERSAPLWRTGVSLAGFLALLAAGCGASLPYGGWQGTAAREAFGEIVAASSGMTAEADAALGKLVAARRTEEGEVIPGFEILFSPIVFQDWSWVSDKPAGYTGTAPNYESIPWNRAYDFSSSIEGQIVLKRPPRGSASLAAGDTFLLFRLAIDSYAGQEATPSAPALNEFDSMTLYGLWIDGRTLLNPLGPRSGWRPYLQYGGGFVQYPSVARDGYENWAAGWVLGWHMAGGIEGRSDRVGVYIQYGMQSIGAPEVDSAAVDPVASGAQDLVTYPLRLGVILSF